jgi:hypothetical protein
VKLAQELFRGVSSFYTTILFKSLGFFSGQSFQALANIGCNLQVFEKGTLV